VPWSNNQYLDDLLPNSETHPLDAGHFAWEQAAEEYGRLIVDWVSGCRCPLVSGRAERRSDSTGYIDAGIHVGRFLWRAYRDPVGRAVEVVQFVMAGDK